MNYQVEKNEGSVKLIFTVNHEEWEKEVADVYLKTKNKYSVPGFRKGHAPRKMIENMYGASVFYEDAINGLVRKGYSQALSENEDIYPVDEPQIDLEKFTPEEVVFTVNVTVLPEVKLGEYKGIKVEKVEYTVKQSDVKAELEKARERLSRFIDVTDRAVKEGDKVNIDYSGSVDGVKFDGGTAEKQDLVIGSKQFIPGFEDQLIGMNIGETRDINVKFPDKYHAKDLAGKDAVFTVKLHKITVKELPELNDEFAQEVASFNTLDEFKADIKRHLTENAKRRSEVETEDNIIKAVVENAEVNIPDCMVETQLDYMVKSFSDQLAYMYKGMKFEDYLKYMGSTVEEFRKDREDEAKNTVKTRLVLEAVIKQENIEVSDEELQSRIKELAKESNRSEDEIKEQGQLAYIKNEVLTRKMLTFLKENNILEKKTKAKKESKKEDSEE